MSAPTGVRTRSPTLPAIRFGGAVPASRLGSFMRWYDRYLQRRALAELDDRMLADIGITRQDVEREIRKPFWRWAPSLTLSTAGHFDPGRIVFTEEI